MWIQVLLPPLHLRDRLTLSLQATSLEVPACSSKVQGMLGGPLDTWTLLLAFSEAVLESQRTSWDKVSPTAGRAEAGWQGLKV